MSINKIFLPELSELVKFLDQNGKDEFYTRFIKGRDSFIGPTDSVNFIDQFFE